ncbi:hypothetical protein M5K25_002519 [Dendrobium thyrsiflorum]|uniref:Uncharacterized protein n=1 Tax=Dendrobium thyrsiflorum TaxID=117978 RepID=A0ABD0VNT5_DENTH
MKDGIQVKYQALNSSFLTIIADIKCKRSFPGAAALIMVVPRHEEKISFRRAMQHWFHGLASSPTSVHDVGTLAYLTLHPGAGAAALAHLSLRTCMADPDVDHGFVYDDQGRIDILNSPFFDVFFSQDDVTADDHLDRILYRLTLSIEEHIRFSQWVSVTRRPPPPKTVTFPLTKNLGLLFFVVLISSCLHQVISEPRSAYPRNLPSINVNSSVARTKLGKNQEGIKGKGRYAAAPWPVGLAEGRWQLGAGVGKEEKGGEARVKTAGCLGVGWFEPADARAKVQSTNFPKWESSLPVHQPPPIKSSYGRGASYGIYASGPFKIENLEDKIIVKMIT